MAETNLPGKGSGKGEADHDNGPLGGGKPVPPNPREDHPSQEAEERSRQVREGDCSGDEGKE